MPFNRLSTAKIAKVVGCHPNTVRLYEQIGFISPVPRSPKGYRLYTEMHLDQMRLARKAMEGGYSGPNIRRSLIALAKMSGTGDFPAALEMAHYHLSVVRVELEQAEAGVHFLNNWVQGKLSVEPMAAPQRIGEVARRLSITMDMLRNWERSGLVTVPRDPSNGYRQYGAAEIGRVRVIRLLRQTGYSPMAILRMLLELDRRAADGPPTRADLRKALDTPRPDEEVSLAADRWLSTLAEEERRALKLLEMAEEMVNKYG